MSSSLSSHVLDAATGRPAEGVHLTLFRRDGEGDFALVRSGRTDPGGRVADWGTLPGVHRLRFDTGAWFAERHIASFYPEVVVAFNVEAGQHYHVPLLLSPFAYSTYRGS